MLLIHVWSPPFLKLQFCCNSSCNWSPEPHHNTKHMKTETQGTRTGNFQVFTNGRVPDLKFGRTLVQITTCKHPISSLIDFHVPLCKSMDSPEIWRNLFSYSNYKWGTRWRSWLRHCATSRKIAGSISDCVIGIFHWHNPSGRRMALGLSQPLTEMSTRNISWG